MKRLTTLCLTTILSGLPIGAHAQFSVIDNANLARAVQQVDAWKKQYQQMLDQQAQLRQQFAALTGSRGLGNFASNPLLQATVPADLLQIMGALQSKGAAGLSDAARQIRAQSKIYDCENRTGDARTLCERLLNNVAQQQALLQSALAMTSVRRQQIQTLQEHINATSDPKSIAELQARLQAENTQVSNDANRLLLMRSLGDAAERAAEQALREKALRSLSLHSDGSDTFHYAPKFEH